MDIKDIWVQHIIIKSLCNTKKIEINEKIIAELKQDHFTSPLYNKVFRRIDSFYKQKGRILTWKEIIIDSSLDNNIRNKLRSKEVKRAKFLKHDSSLELVKTFEEYKSMVKNLHHSSQFKGLVTLQNELTEKLKQNNTSEEIKTLIDLCVTKIDDIKGLDNSTGTIYKLTGDNVSSTIKDFYKNIKNNFFVPTGFKAFDDINMGIPLDSYFLIAGRTSSGKSSLSVQLCINMKRQGCRICLLPLEMSIEQMLLRLGSNLIKVPVNELTKNLKKYFKPFMKKVRKFLKQDKDSPACLHFYEPDVDETLDESLNILKKHNYDMILVDYINLMSPMGGEEGWKSLDIAGRYAKRFATNNKTIICLLAQLDDKTKDIRYSRALKEHACVVGDTLIDTPEGLISISKIAQADTNKSIKAKKAIITNGVIPAYTSHFHNKGLQDVRKIELEDGRSIIGTPLHKLLVITENFKLEWREFKDIKRGDIIAQSSSKKFTKKNYPLNYTIPSNLKYNTKIPEIPKIINYKLGYIIGILLSDGYIGKYGVLITNCDFPIIKKSQKYLNSLFGKGVFKTGVEKTKIGNTVYRLGCVYKLVIEFFESITGMQGGTFNKYPPDEILQSPKKVIIECIKGMYDGDGGNKGNQINYTSYSPQMLVRLQLLLDKLDIQSSIRDKCLNILGENTEIFRKIIGFTPRRKQKTKRLGVLRQSNRTIYIPYLNSYLRSHPVLGVIDDPEHRSSVGTRLTRLLGGGSDRGCRFELLNNRIINKIGKVNKEVYNTLHKIYNEKIKFQKVVSNTKERKKQVVYDLTVPKTHNYTANGLYSHNSNAWVWYESGEDVKELGYIKIKQVKARNQNPKPFKLKVDLSVSRFRDYNSKPSRKVFKSKRVPKGFDSDVP